MTHEYSKNWSRSWRISQEVSRSLKLNATEFTDSEKFKFSIWKSGICHFRSSVTHHGWNRILRTAHFTEWLLCVNTAYPDGLRFYDFQILSSGFWVKIFSRATSSPHLASAHMLKGTCGHQSSAGTDTIVCGHITRDNVSTELWLPQSWSMKDYSPEFVQSLPAPVS